MIINVSICQSFNNHENVLRLRRLSNLITYKLSMSILWLAKSDSDYYLNEIQYNYYNVLLAFILQNTLLKRSYLNECRNQI